MREAVYLILSLTTAGPVRGFEAPTEPEVKAVRQHGAPVWLDLQTDLSAPSSQPLRKFAALLTSAAEIEEAQGRGTASAANNAGRTLAWALPAGLTVLAAGAFGQSALIGQPAWPLGATVPAVKTSAAIALDLDRVTGPPVRLNLAINRNWQLDGPIGGTHPDCALRFELTAENAPKLSFQAPCGPAGHFGFAIRGSF